MPHSPQIDSTPRVYPSLHSSEFQSCGEESDEVQPIAKRVLFASDFGRHGDEPEEESDGVPSSRRPSLFSRDDGEGREPFAPLSSTSKSSVTSEAYFPSDSRLDEALEHEDAHALVVSLQGRASWVAWSVVKLDMETRKLGGFLLCF